MSAKLNTKIEKIISENLDMDQNKVKMIIRNAPYVTSVGKLTENFTKVILDITVKYDLKKVLDVGTGSRYIAIILAKQGKIVDASDISDRALELAAENAIATHTQINLIKSNLFKNIHNEYDLISFNPPCGNVGKFGTFIRNILNKILYERLRLGLGYFLYKEFRLQLLARFLKECRPNLKKGRGLIVLLLFNMELPSMMNLFKENQLEIIEEYPVTRLTKAVVARSLE